jgi:hypothetical protein
MYASQCHFITDQKGCIISQCFDFRICIYYENTNNSVILLKFSVKRSMFQCSNTAVMQLLNMCTGCFSLMYIVSCVKSELAEYVRDCGRILFFILFKEIAGE